MRTIAHILRLCPIRSRYLRWRIHLPFWAEDKTAQMLGIAQFGCPTCGYGAIKERDALAARQETTVSEPEPLNLDRSEPKMFVQQVGCRWRSWVEIGACIVERECGTYSWTRERAEMKARKLLEFATRHNTNPKIEIQP